MHINEIGLDQPGSWMVSVCLNHVEGNRKICNVSNKFRSFMHAEIRSL